MANLDVIGAFCSAENCQVKSIWAWEGGTANAAYYLLFSFCSLFFSCSHALGREKGRDGGWRFRCRYGLYRFFSQCFLWLRLLSSSLLTDVVFPCLECASLPSDIALMKNQIGAILLLRYGDD